MTETLTRAHGRTTQQNLRRRALALVLFLVLVWYTVVSPSYAAAPLRATDAGQPDAEERELATPAAAGPVGARAAVATGGFGIDGVADELDWPEIIGDE